jgi:hypothetical protein
VRNRLNKKDRVRLNARMKIYNIKLLDYAEGLLEVTNLFITSLNEVPKR